MKKFCVFYDVTTSYDADIQAKSKEEAANKVREVLGEVVIKQVWEVQKCVWRVNT